MNETGTVKTEKEMSEYAEYGYSVKAKILSVAEFCEREAGMGGPNGDPVKERKEAYLKVAEKLKDLANGRYVRRLRVYGC